MSSKRSNDRQLMVPLLPFEGACRRMKPSLKSVIPAQAGNPQRRLNIHRSLDSRLRGMTND